MDTSSSLSLQGTVNQIPYLRKKLKTSDKEQHVPVSKELTLGARLKHDGGYKGNQSDK